jgi:hypothetical protein
MCRDLMKANKDRLECGIPEIRDPSFDTFSRILTSALPPEQMQGRPRKVTRK